MVYFYKGVYMKFKRKAFTLTELLVVVIVLGVLAGVSAPKLMRVLESRRTTEAENILSAVRTEQEQRCLAGKKYETEKMSFPALVEANRSGNYTYTLQLGGAVAVRKNAKLEDAKYYELRMSSYKTGELCCSGAYCSSLNKDYPSCGAAIEVVDECKANVDPAMCEKKPESCECSTYYEADCNCDNRCQPCDINPNSCSCSEYEAANPCFCAGIDPNSCACEAYAATHACECQRTVEACGCQEGQVLNTEPTVPLCQDPECNNEYSAWTTTSESVTDTCPGGDTNSAYTCDGTWSGTCTDVSGLEATRIGTSGFAAADPFSNFRNTILLAVRDANEAVDFFDDHLSLDDQEQEVQDLDGDIVVEHPVCVAPYYWDASLGRCELEPEDPEDPGNCGFMACLGGATLNPTTCQCELNEYIDDGSRLDDGEALEEDDGSEFGHHLQISHRVRTVTCCAGKIDPPETCTRTCSGNFTLNATSCTCECSPSLSQVQTCNDTANASWNNTSCSCVVSEDPGSVYECTSGQTNTYADPNDSNKTCTQNCIVLKGQTGGTWGRATCSCAPIACPGNKTLDPDTCECVESEEETITCLTSSYWQTYTETMTGSCTFATGQWIPDYSTQQMLTECGGAVGFISCTAGQPCDCIPGKKYVVYDSNIYSCIAEGACHQGLAEEYTRKYGFYCATCGEVSSTSGCRASWTNMTGQNCGAGGSGGGSHGFQDNDQLLDFMVP